MATLSVERCSRSSGHDTSALGSYKTGATGQLVTTRDQSTMAIGARQKATFWPPGSRTVTWTS